MKKTLDVQKTVMTVIGINGLQIAASLAIFGYTVFTGKSPISNMVQLRDYLFLFILVAVSILNGLVAVRDAGYLTRAGSEQQAFEETLSELENLNRTLRGQRHDFMNHLQVVYGLIEMDEYKDARDYIEKVYNDIQKVSKVLKTSNAAVNALLQAKILDAEKKGIITGLHVTTQLNGLRVPSWEFCRVLGNILDNAIDALEEKTGEKHLSIELFEDLKSHGFRVGNDGPGIPEGLREKIFEPGFTTKIGMGQGMGLSISKDILQAYGGSLSVKSDETFTLFEGIAPKQ